MNNVFHDALALHCLLLQKSDLLVRKTGRCLHVRRANANFAVQKKNDVKGIDLNTPATRQENHAYLYL